MRVVQTKVVNNRIIVNSMEPRGAIGLYDPETDRTTSTARLRGRALSIRFSPK